MRYLITLLAVLAFATAAWADCPGDDDSGCLTIPNLPWHGRTLSSDGCTLLDAAFSWYEWGGGPTVIKAYITAGRTQVFSCLIDSDIVPPGFGSCKREEVRISGTPIQGHIVKISGDNAFTCLRLQYNTY